MFSLNFLYVIAIIFAPFHPFVSSLEHQWVSYDNSDAIEDIPVLHTAFVQTGAELHYFSEGSQYEKDKYIGHRSYQDVSKTSCRERYYAVKKDMERGEFLPLEFDPPYLDFGNSPVGVPVVKKVTVRNRLNKVVILDSIMGSTFIHASFFDKIELEPMSSASFEVAFLPREEIAVFAKLNIHTSSGIFQYITRGRSIHNPYRIQPAVGHRLAFNATISRPITLHNPHPNTLRIKGITSSGGNTHIELPYGIDPQLAGEHPQYWDIRPYQTKIIGKAVLLGHTAENSTNFVRINGAVLDSHGKEIEDVELMLVIPFEVTHRSNRGVFSTSDLLDFGLLRQNERSPAQTFSVYQSALNGRVEFETLYVEKGDATGIYMEFASHPPIAVHAGKTTGAPGPPADLVKVFFDASRIHFEDKKPAKKHFEGRIIAVSRGGNYNITIPFRASVFQGEILPVRNDLSIQEDLKPPYKRAVRLLNRLPFPVAIYNISVSEDARPYFTVRLFEKSVVLPIGEDRPVFLLKYNKKVPESFGTAVFYVNTNVSTFRVNLYKFNGRAKFELHSLEQENLDFGLVERNDTRTIRFTVHNPNKASMSLRPVKMPDPSIFRLYSMEDPTSPTEIFPEAELDIEPEESLTFDLEVRVPMDGSVHESSLVLETDYESRSFPVTYQVATGSLASIPDVLSFGQTHPGRVVYRNLQVFNSFTEDMTLTRLSVLSPDRRFFFEHFDTTNPPLLRSGRLTNLGRVMLMPEAPCVQDDCYLGMPLHTTDGQWFVHGLTLPANLAEVDSYLYKKQRAKFDNLVAAGKHLVNTTIVLDTDKAKNIRIPTTAELNWPRLLTRNSVHFPLTALGNFTIVNLTLSNPTSVPIVVQVIPLVIYPDAEAVVDFFREHLLTPLTSQVEMNETLMFSLRDTELFTLKPDSPVPQLREELEQAIHQSVPKFTLSLLLKPHMKIRLRLGFLPSDYTLRSSLLLIRNNLTVIEPVVVYGRGARIGMKVEGIEARSKTPLLFEIKHDHLSDCNNPKRLMHKLQSTLTVRRPFIVSNTGEVPFNIVNMSINGFPCENRGFRILNCYPFRLGPNETYALDIAYTPDFLASTNEADLQLYMHMNGTSWLFPLAATVPADMMARCHSALPRPPFENLMYYSCVTALVFCLICILACAYLEGDRAIACSIRDQYTATRTIFDLNSPDPVKKTQPPKDTWKGSSQPSSLNAAVDASPVSIYFYKSANVVLSAVHHIWKLSLRWRSKESELRTQQPKKKKKAKVSVVGSKPKNEQKQEETKEMKNNAKAPISQKNSTPGPQQQSKKALTPVNNNNNKLTAKQSVSPKAATNSRAEKENQRKKSNDAERRMTQKLEKTQKLMDFDVAAEASRRLTRGAKPPVIEKLPERRSPSRQASTSKEEPIDQQFPTLPEEMSFMQLPGLNPYLYSLPAEYYSQLAEDDSLSYRPPTPTPSLVSHFSYEHLNIATDSPNGQQSSTASEPSPSGDPLRHRTPSEGEVSLVSEPGSAPPDWMDEAVVAGNLEDDFNALVQASEMLGSGSDWGSESAISSVSGEEKKIIRNRKRGKRGKGKKEDEEPAPRERTSTYGDWPIPPSIPLLDDINWQLPSLAPGTSWLPQMPNESSSSLQANKLKNTEIWPSTSSGSESLVGNNVWSDTLNPASLGLPLNLPLGSIYSGEFDLWSQTTDGPSVSWSNILNLKKKEEERSE